MEYTAVIISDTHGKRDRIRTLLDRCFAMKKPPDAIYFLGDVESDLKILTQREQGLLFAVAGNCDIMSSLPDTFTVDVQGKKILLCHGHTFGVKGGETRLYLAAQSRGADAAVFGHTHERFLCCENGITLFNPGSLGRPVMSQPSFGVLTVRDGELLFSHGEL